MHTLEHAYYATMDTMHRVLVLYELSILCISRRESLPAAAKTCVMMMSLHSGPLRVGVATARITVCYYTRVIVHIYIP